METTASAWSVVGRRVLRVAAWMTVCALSTVIAFLLINNRVDTGFHDRARDVVSYEYNAYGSPVALDKDGNIVNNPDANNPIDDIIKIGFVALAVVGFEEGMRVLVHRWWISIFMAVLALFAALPALWWLSFLMYFSW